MLIQMCFHFSSSVIALLNLTVSRIVIVSTHNNCVSNINCSKKHKVQSKVICVINYFISYTWCIQSSLFSQSKNKTPILVYSYTDSSTFPLPRIMTCEDSSANQLSLLQLSPQCIIIKGTQCIIINGTQCIIIKGIRCIIIKGIQCIIIKGTQCIIIKVHVCSYSSLKLKEKNIKI